MLFRALFGGGVIGFAVFIGRVGGPHYGGVFATFPAMYISTLAITFYSGGMEFSRGMAKALVMSGTINVPVYAMAVKLLYPLWGLIWGTLASLLITGFTGWLTYRFMRSHLI